MPSLYRRTFEKFTLLTGALLPSSCVLCGCADDALLCAPCEHQFFKQGSHRCLRCALPLVSGNDDKICGECLKNLPAFDRTIVACNYVAPLDQIVLALKFGHRLPLASLFSQTLRDAILRETEHALPDLLSVVPLGAKRLQERGFNQAAEIAKPLSKNLGLPLALQLLVRTRETAQQSSLHPNERHKNMRKAFALNDKSLADIGGKHIAVVDDVMTTGATLNEIAKLLKSHGASKVSNYVFARTIPH